MSDDASENTKPEEATPEPTSYITIGIAASGFSFSIPDGINPITLSGAGWYLMHMAGIGLNNQLVLQAQKEQASAAKAITPIRGTLRDHLPKREH